jgi:hypothetical protein
VRLKSHGAARVGLGVAKGDHQDGGAEGDGDPGGEDQGSGGGAENFVPRPPHGGEDFSPQCRYGQLVGGPHDLFLMFSRRVLVRIDIGTGSAIETDTGIGVGDPISEVEDAYGDELERELHPYLGDRGSYLIFDPEPEDGLLIIFETNRRSVTSFRSGFDQQVRYKEGCA